MKMLVLCAKNLRIYGTFKYDNTSEIYKLLLLNKLILASLYHISRTLVLLFSDDKFLGFTKENISEIK